MTHYALDASLIEESQYLRNFDAVFASINSQYDLLDKDLHALIRMAYGNGGVLSLNRRKQYAHRVPVAALDAIEGQVQRVFFADDDAPEAAAAPRPRARG